MKAKIETMFNVRFALNRRNNSLKELVLIQPGKFVDG